MNGMMGMEDAELIDYVKKWGLCCLQQRDSSEIKKEREKRNEDE